MALNIEAEIGQSRLIGGATHKCYNDLEAPRCIGILCCKEFRSKNSILMKHKNIHT
jgi:hypothetical protein